MPTPKIRPEIPDEFNKCLGEMPKRQCPWGWDRRRCAIRLGNARRKRVPLPNDSCPRLGCRLRGPRQAMVPAAVSDECARPEPHAKAPIAKSAGRSTLWRGCPAVGAERFGADKKGPGKPCSPGASSL